MKAILLLALCFAPAFALQAQPTRAVDQALTNLLADVVAIQQSSPSHRSLPWSTERTPAGDPVPSDEVKPDWAFARGRVASLGARVAVWTFDGPAGSTWCLLAETDLGGGPSNTVRRALWPAGARPPIDLPTDWDAPGKPADLRRPN